MVAGFGALSFLLGYLLYNPSKIGNLTDFLIVSEIKNFYDTILLNCRNLEQILSQNSEFVNRIGSVQSITFEANHYVKQLEELGYTRSDSILIYNELKIRGDFFPYLEPFEAIPSPEKLSDIQLRDRKSVV